MLQAWACFTGATKAAGVAGFVSANAHGHWNSTPQGCVLNYKRLWSPKA